MASIERFCEAMRWAADSDQVGYSQSDRDSLQPWDFFGDGLYNTDCSILTINAAKYAGFDTGWASYTGNMTQNFTERGWESVWPDGNPQRGDILLNDGCHAAVWLGDCIAQASIDEHGNIAGGARGDQTGGEVNTTWYYDYPWTRYLRYTGPTDEDGPHYERGEDVQPVNNYGGDVIRLYNPNGFHIFTLDEGEISALVEAGWIREGVAFTAPRGGVEAVYRMFNPYSGDHLFTTDYSEAEGLIDEGWRWEGVPFFADPDGKPVYRLYSEGSGEHFYTADVSEAQQLQESGWVREGVAFRV